MAGASDSGKADQALSGALEALAEAYERAARVVDGIADPQEALAAANRLATQLRISYENAAELRNKIAYKIWKTEELSLAALAQRIGVSKARADQIVRAARSDEGQEEH